MRPAVELRRRLADPDVVTTGVLCSLHLWPGLVEVVRRAGLDYLIIDLEHLPFDSELVADVCAIGRREDFAVIVRPGDSASRSIRAALDLGPCGLLVPAVASTADMDRIADAALMPPRGTRRPGGPAVRWVSDVHADTWRTEVEDSLLIMPQIETLEGLDNATAIAAHRLTTAIAIGPYDLSAQLGVCWDPGSAALRDAIERIRAAGTAAGKSMWMIGDGPALVADGFRFVCLGEPTMALEGALRAAAESTRRAERAR